MLTVASFKPVSILPRMNVRLRQSPAVCLDVEDIEVLDSHDSRRRL